MRTIRTLLLAALVSLGLAAARPAAACTIAQDRLTGGYWIQYYQGGVGGQMLQWGDANNAAMWVNAINKTCNDLQSTGSVNGNIRWFDSLEAPNYAIGEGPSGWKRCGFYYCYYTNPSAWVTPNEGAVFYWNDTVQWNRAVSCTVTAQIVQNGVVRAQWTCTHQQSRDNGVGWAGTSTMILQPSF